MVGCASPFTQRGEVRGLERCAAGVVEDAVGVAPPSSGVGAAKQRDRGASFVVQAIAVAATLAKSGDVVERHLGGAAPHEGGVLAYAASLRPGRHIRDHRPRRASRGHQRHAVSGRAAVIHRQVP